MSDVSGDSWDGSERFEDYPGIDLWKVIGDRRAIRYFLPYRPVERWKIEMMFQAGHRSSRAINGSFIKNLAVGPESPFPQTPRGLKEPAKTSDLRDAPRQCLH